MVITGGLNLPLTWASGTDLCKDSSEGTHIIAPAGLCICFHLKLSKLVRYKDVYFVGLCVQAPCNPLVTVSSELPLPHFFFSRVPDPQMEQL